MRKNLKLVLAIISYNTKQNLAYFGENWANFFSTIFYTLSYLVVLHLTFREIGTVAGYTLNDILLIMLLLQLSLYAVGPFSDSLGALSIMINDGSWDLVLLKPLPRKLYLLINSFSPVYMVRDGVAILLVIWDINWGSLHITLRNVVLGMIILLLGFVLDLLYLFTTALLAFWQESGGNPFLKLAIWGVNGGGTEYPESAIQGPLRKFLIFFMPGFLVANVSTAIMIGKLSIMNVLPWAIMALSLAYFLQRRLWRASLKRYTSASS